MSVTDTGQVRTVVARHAGYNLVGQVFPLVIAIIALPVVVRGLGPARFGLLALAWTIVGYFGLVDFGFGRAATQRIASVTAADRDHRSVAAVAGTVVLFQAGLGLASGLALWLSSPLLGAWLVPGEAGALRAEGEAVLQVLALALPAVLVANAYRAILEGLARFDLVNAVRAPFSAALFLIPMIGVLADWTIVTIVIALVASRWLAPLVYHRVYTRLARGQRGRFDVLELRTLVRFGGWVAISNLVIPAVVYLERFVLSAQRGPEALGYYAAPHELMLKLLVIPAALTSVLYPLFSGYNARRDAAGLERGLTDSTRLLAILIAPVTATFVLLAIPLLSLWLGDDHALFGGTVLRLLATAAFLNSLALVPFVLLEGAGRPDLVTKYHLAELPFYLALLWIMVGEFGIVGAAAAWLIRVAIMTLVLFGLAVNVARLTFASVVWRRPALAVSAGVLLLTTAHVWSLTTDSSAVWLGLVLPAAYGVLAWRSLLGADERAALINVLRKPFPTHTGSTQRS